MDYINNCIKTIKEWIKIRSVKSESVDGAPFGSNIRKMLDLALQKGEELGFETFNREGYVGEIVYGSGNDKDGLAILCHLDVVPEGDLSQWKFDPYSGTEEEGVIYGRGVVDDKGAAVICLYVMKELKDDGFIPNRKIKLILGCDEESGWGCMDYYLNNYIMPDEGISPDADFPVIYAEKGILHVEYSFKKPNIIDSVYGGTRVNVVPDRCYIKLNNNNKLRFEKKDGYFCAIGKSAHGSTPDKGTNAFELILNELKNNEECAYIYNKLFEERSIFEKFTDESGKLTFSPNVIKSDENNIYVSVDIRYPVTSDKNELIKCLKNIGNFKILNEQLPLYVNKNDRLINNLQKAYLEVTGENLEPIAIGGGTYARALKKGVAFGPNFGNSECHVPNEYMTVDEIRKCYNIYKLAIKEMCK